MQQRDEKQWRTVSVRMPADRAAELELAAERSHRSLSAEVQWRLDEYERMLREQQEEEADGTTPRQ